MKTLSLACRAGTVLAVLFICCRAFAQSGCDEELGTVQIQCDVSPATYVTSTFCFGGGDPGDYCSESTFHCDGEGQTGNEWYTANIAPDESCDPPPTCCNGGVLCTGRQLCDPGSCSCQYASPIVVDTTGKGFHLTTAAGGVMFDIAGGGHPVKMAWTAAGSGNALLALDRNHNGKIDDGEELFGNFTAQPESSAPNGYLALAEFDKPENGGNGDGIIDSRDAVYSKLLLWIDENHDGISQPGELHSLQDLGVFSISLHYADDHHDDSYGNWFHYKAALNPDPRDGTSKDGRWTYDVFFELVQDHPLVTQSRIARPLRHDQWQPAIGGAYWSGVLYDELAFALPRAKASGCPSPTGTR